EIQGLMEENEQYAVETKNVEEIEHGKITVQRLLKDLQKQLPQVKQLVKRNQLDAGLLQKAEDQVHHAKEAIRDGNLRELKELEKSLERSISIFAGILSLN
ncbi:MAG: hypothetical protein KC609_11950, partial [Myxococcales bacterium]|nr:hypothetical protein [Myxococcales bacterium]